MAEQTPDPWLPAKFKVFSAMVAAESKLYSSILDLLGRWATKVRTAVFGSTGWKPKSPLAVVSPSAARSANHWFGLQLDDEVLIEVKEIFDWASGDIADPEPNGAHRAQQAVRAARNRLANVPDAVFRQVQAQTFKATTEGWSIDELAGHIDEVLAEAGAERWKNRARTIARTEAVAAYNGGTYSGFLSYAQAVPGNWEKIWLETHDHRTRDTHQAGAQGFGNQRVPLTAMFRHGDVEMLYPGWPLGPANETINCRCSLLLAHQGEIIDFSNRHYKGGA
jgi:hypothetical protein